MMIRSLCSSNRRSQWATRLATGFAALPWLLMIGSVVIGGKAALAATITVTITDDVIAIDGECSLREAVTAANSNAAFSDCPTGEALPIIDEVELPDGVYSLTLEPAGEDANAGGDLDILEAVTIRGLAEDFVWWDDAATPEVETLDVYNDPDSFPRVFAEEDLPGVVIENGLGDKATPGDGDRVIHILDPVRRGVANPRSEVGLPHVTFENLAIAHGDASCSGASCLIRSAGIFHSAVSGLTLRRAALFENRLTCSGLGCGSASNAAALRYDGTLDLRILDSVVAGNLSTCADTECSTGRLILTSLTAQAVELDQTLVVGNRQICSTTDCRIHRSVQLASNDVRLTQTAFLDHESSCETAGSACEVDEFFEAGPTNSTCVDTACALLLEDVEFSENRLTCEGLDCDVDELLNPRPFFVQTLRRVRANDNLLMCSGVSCGLDEMMDFRQFGSGEGVAVVLDDLEILDNTNQCFGADCGADAILNFRGDSFATLSDVRVRGASHCEGDRCAAGGLVELEGFASVSGLSVEDSSVTCTGAECSIKPLVEIDVEPPLEPVVETLQIVDSRAECTGIDCGFSPGFIGDGGILVVPTPQSGSTSVTVRDATITGNVTTARGSVANGTVLEIADSVISGNQSASDGGAILNGVSEFDGGPLAAAGLLLRDTVLDGNLSGRHGGGVFNPVGGTVALVGATITNNTALDGGGIYNEGTIVLQQASSIVGNTPNQCVDVLGAIGCDALFIDGFESGDLLFWSSSTP